MEHKHQGHYQSNHVHHWLEMCWKKDMVVAICNSNPSVCKEKGTFTHEEWERMAALGQCKNKPVRL